MAAAVLTKSPMKDAGLQNADVRSACLMIVGAVLRREEARGIWLNASAQDLVSGQTAYAILMDARNRDSSGGVQKDESHGLDMYSVLEYAGKRCPLTNTSYLAEATDAAKRQQDGLVPTTLERVTKVAAYATAVRVHPPRHSAGISAHGEGGVALCTIHPTRAYVQASTVVLYHLDLVFDCIVLQSTTASPFYILRSAFRPLT